MKGMRCRNTTLTVLSALLMVHGTDAQPAETPLVTDGAPYANESGQQRDERMAWWREAKFGMFIHWGVYAVLAGNYGDIRDAE